MSATSTPDDEKIEHIIGFSELYVYTLVRIDEPVSSKFIT